MDKKLLKTLRNWYEFEEGQVFINQRSALYALLRQLNFPEDTAVAVQSFTCVTAISPVLWAGLTPVYIDIDEKSLAMSLVDLQKKWTDNIRVVMVQDFLGLGTPNLIKIAEFVHKHGAILVVDGAHALGVRDYPEADVVLLSFGTEKMLGTKFGGAFLVKNSLNFHPDSEDIAKPLPWRIKLAYFFDPVYWRFMRMGKMGQMFGAFLEKLNMRMQSIPNRDCTKPYSYYPGKLPPLLGWLVIRALSGLGYNLSYRARVVKSYISQLKKTRAVDTGCVPIPDAVHAGMPLLKLPIICRSSELRDWLYDKLAEGGIPVSKWYSPTIFPTDVVVKQRYGYDSNSCPISERISGRILDLPTGGWVDEGFVAKLVSKIEVLCEEFCDGEDENIPER